MRLNPDEQSPADFYRFMISVIVPRPIAFVSTTSAAGVLNIAPFSYFCAITNRPPLVGISLNQRRGQPKDTLRNIRETGEFVINVVDEPLAARMVQTSGDWPESVDEFQLTGLTPAPSDRVKPPRVAESPVHLECRTYREFELGDATFVVGEILSAHVEERVLSDGRVDPLKLHALGRLGGDGYTVVNDILHLPRPKVGA